MMKTRRETFLPFHRPAYDFREVEAVSEVLQSPWITTGPKTREFETAFAQFVGADAALALNSCTAGLHVALIAKGIGVGNEVITSPITFCASANVIEHVGANTVFADVDPVTLNLDPKSIESKITEHTKAIMPVHYAGHPVDLASIRSIADNHNLTVIEDAAHPLPASIHGTRIGASPSLASFSFYATKNLSTGEGGMLVGDEETIERSRIIALHGLSRDAYRRYDKGGSWKYEVMLPGFKYNMTDIQAALGLAQLAKLEELQQRRLEIVRAYGHALKNSKFFETPAVLNGYEHSWHLYVVRLNLDTLKIDRDRFIDELFERNIGVSVHFIPLHTQPYYRKRYNYSPTHFPIAWREYQRIVSLPIYPSMSHEDVQDVVEALTETAKEHAR